MSDVDALVIGAGQAGLAAARAFRRAGVATVVLEAGPAPVGSWPNYYDSLRLFSPARYSALPGLPMTGDPDRYPHRDEVIAYLQRYADSLDIDIRTGHRVRSLTRQDGQFVAHLETGTAVTAGLAVAATGAFGRPHLPHLPGQERFTGQIVHAADYARPGPFAGQRIVVVGAANSAVQIGVELAAHAHVTLATRHAIKFTPARPLGRDVHFWSALSGIDHLPLGHLLTSPPRQPVNDPGGLREAIEHGQPDQRAMFRTLDRAGVRWADGSREDVDTLILATGYRPNLTYLHDLGALAPDGGPRQRRGLSLTHSGLGYVGLEWQRSFASATLRGVGRDAEYVARHLLRAASGRTTAVTPARPGGVSRTRSHR